MYVLTLAHHSTVSPATHQWSFLDWWSFLGTLATLAGLLIGFLGVYIAIKQINKTISAAAASANTARNMLQQQLSTLLKKLGEVRSQIEKCATTDNRDEMRSLLDEWVLLAKEAQGIIAHFESPRRTVSGDFRSELGLDSTPFRGSPASQYASMECALTGAASAARNALQTIERESTSKKTLIDLTRVCRKKIANVVDESAGFQVWLNALIATGKALDSGN